jgi:hypothetical protein
MQPDPLKEALKAQLLSLGYPWPENLEGKSMRWLEAELRAIRGDDTKANDPSS